MLYTFIIYTTKCKIKVSLNWFYCVVISIFSFILEKEQIVVNVVIVHFFLFQTISEARILVPVAPHPRTLPMEPRSMAPRKKEAAQTPVRAFVGIFSLGLPTAMRPPRVKRRMRSTRVRRGKTQRDATMMMGMNTRMRTTRRRGRSHLPASPQSRLLPAIGRNHCSPNVQAKPMAVVECHLFLQRRDVCLRRERNQVWVMKRSQ